MKQSILAATLFTLAASQTMMVNPISQIGDGQIQAPTDPQPSAAPPVSTVPSSFVPPPEPSVSSVTTPPSSAIPQSPVPSSPEPISTTSPQPPPAPPVTPTAVPPTTGYTNSTSAAPSQSVPVDQTTVLVTSTQARSSNPIASVTGNAAGINHVTGAGLALLIVSIPFFML